ncbi:kinase-like domain-containing protein [Phycomyces blakesleeanus]
MMVGTLAEQGNLENFIGRPIPFSMPAVLYAVTRLAVNMASLHDEIKMCHRNVHPRNVLCGDDYHLVDYRFSTASNEATKVTQQAMVHYGRIPYIAPEVRQGIYTEKSDVYSLGIMMWQLISGINFPDPEILLSNTNVYRIERIPGVPRWYQDLIIACLEPHPNNRPTSEEVGNITRRFADSESDARISPEWMAYVVRRRDEIKRSHQGVAKNQASVPVSRVYPLRQLQNPLPIHSSFLNRPLDMASFSALSSLT